jgi:hypothetical protein
MRSTLSTFTKHTMDRVRRRTSKKQRSMTFGGAQFAPQEPGESEERQQLGQILLQPPDHGGVDSAPARTEPAKGSDRLHPGLTKYL